MLFAMFSRVVEVVAEGMEMVDSVVWWRLLFWGVLADGEVDM